MAGDPSSKTASPRTPGGRTTPVLVPQGALAGQPDVPLDRPVTTVGSNETSRLHLVSRTVSGGHAIFVNSGGITYVADLASRTGVLVNGRLVKDAELKTGDRVQIGKFVFRYRSPSNQAPALPSMHVPPASVIVVGSPAIPVTSRAVIIGRRETSDIPITTDSAVSSAHAVIFQLDGAWCMRDLGSRTGTIVNGKPIHQQILNFGDRITVGSSTILFQPGAVAVYPEDSGIVELSDDFSKGLAEEHSPEPIPVAEEPAPAEASSSVGEQLTDWKTAFPGETAAEIPVEEPAVIPLEESAPAATEPDAELASALEDFELEPLAIAETEDPAVHETSHTPVDDAPIPLESIEPEPQAAAPHAPAAEVPAVEEESLDLIDFADEPAAAPLELEPVDETAETPQTTELLHEPAVVDDEPLELVDEAVEPTVQPVEQPIELAAEVTVPADEPLELEQEASTPVEEVAHPLDEASVLTERAPVVDEEPLALAAEPTDEAAAAIVEPSIPVEQEPIIPADEVNAPVEPLEQPPESVAVEPLAPSPAIEDTLAAIDEMPALAQTASSASIPQIAVPSVEHLLADVDDFVFVPTDESADPNAIPDVIFWGDDELDAATEQAVAQPAPPVTVSATPAVEAPAPSIPPVEDEHPEAEDDASDEGPSDPPPSDPIPPSPGDSSLPTPDTETVETPVEASPVAEVVADEPAIAPMEVAEVVDAVAAPQEQSFELPAIPEIECASPSEDHSPAIADVQPFEVIPASEPHIDTTDFAVHDPEIEPVSTDEPAATEEPAVEILCEPAPEPIAEPDLHTGSVVLEIPELSDASGEGDSQHDLDATAVATSVTETVAGGDTTPEAFQSPQIQPEDLEAFHEPDPLADFGTVEAPLLDELELVPEETTTAVAGMELSDPELEAPVEPQDGQPVDESIFAEFEEPELEVEPVEAVAEPTITETPRPTDFSAVTNVDADSVLDAPVEETITLSEQFTPPPETAGVESTNESDLEFLDFGDSPEAEAPVEESNEIPVEEIAADNQPAAEAVPTDDKPAPEASPRGGPSIFGFDFEGGSFLGGMPISLADKSAIPELLAAAAAAKNEAPVAPAPAIAPPAPTPPSPPVGFDPRVTPPSGLSGVLAVPTGPMAAPTVQQSAARSRPATPPQPRRAGGASLTGLVSEARSITGTPVIPPVAKGVTATAVGAAAGLTGAVSGAGLASRTVEVFSQLSEPIGVEVFGGRPGNPDQFVVPDIKETQPDPEPPAEPDTEPTAEKSIELQPAPQPAESAAPARNTRWWRLPTWIAMLLIMPAVVWALTNRFVQESYTFVGQLSFAGLANQQPVDAHNFVEQQKRLLLSSASDQVRGRAAEILQKDGHPPGFMADSSQFAENVQNQNLVFADNTLEYTLSWPDQVMGNAQVESLLLALAEKDHDLDQQKQQARLDADNAKAHLDEVNAKLAQLTSDHQLLANKAEDKPDMISVNDADQDVQRLTQQYNSAVAARTSSESVLAELKTEDPTKPIDPDTDKEILDLKSRLDPLNAQLQTAKSKGVSAASGTGVGTDVSVGATTQPDSAVDPLLATVQQQADLLTGKIQRRKDELAAMAAIPADQRAVNLATAIENLSIKISGQQKAEADLKKQLDAATARAQLNHKRLDDAAVADVQKEEKYREMGDTERERQTAVAVWTAKETAYANCITVAGAPVVRQTAVTDLRRRIVLAGSILSCFVFGLLAIGELRRPRLITAVRPAAAPRIPPPPARVIPWPQPRQMQAAKTAASADPSDLTKNPQAMGA